MKLNKNWQNILISGIAMAGGGLIGSGLVRLLTQKEYWFFVAGLIVLSIDIILFGIFKGIERKDFKGGKVNIKKLMKVMDLSNQVMNGSVKFQDVPEKLKPEVRSNFCEKYPKDFCKNCGEIHTLELVSSIE